LSGWLKWGVHPHRNRDGGHRVLGRLAGGMHGAAERAARDPDICCEALWQNNEPNKT
jgi:hypothetical protein